MDRLFGAFLALVGYTAAMGLSMAMMHHGFRITYGGADMMRALALPMTVIAFATAWVAYRHFGGFLAGFDRMNTKALLWLIPLGLPIILSAPAIFMALPTGNFITLLLIGYTAVLVGFAEELAFRGIAMRVFWERYGRLTAILLSAAFFSVLHAVNVLGGLTPVDVGLQLVSTFLFGLCAASILLRLGSLWPLMIFHILWNFVLIAGTYVEAQTPYTAFALPIQFFLALVLLTMEIRNARQSRSH